MTERRKNSESGESSKSAEKRAKKQRTAVVAATINEGSNVSVRLSDESSNSQSNSFSNMEGASNDTQVKIRKKRGPSKLRNEDKGKSVEVDFNERSQPIGKASVKLSTFLGALVRENVKVTLDRWSELPNPIEQTLWACVKQKYNLDESRKKMIVQKMGKHLRDYKSILSKMIRELAQDNDAANQLALMKPDNLTSEEWAAFMKKRLSAEFEAKSKVFQEMRKNQELPHTMSRKGYARLEDEMKKENDRSDNPKELSRMDVWIRGHTRNGGKPINELVAEVVRKLEECPKEPTNSIKNDALAKVIGPERRGWVRGMGFGSVPSKVDALTEKNVTMKQFRSHISYLEQQLEELRAIVTQGGKTTESQRSNDENIANSNKSANKSQNSSVGTQGGEPHIDAKCKLLHWMGTGVIVAEAKIGAIDPEALVHHVPLGPRCWKVWVDRVIVNVPLFRPTQEFFSLENAVGSTVAWPIEFIVLDN